MKVSTIDSIHTVLHQILQIAVDDDYIRNNPSDNVLRELKKSHAFQSEKRRALTRPEQDLFLDYLKTHPVYEHWYPVFAVMIGTGLRVGEVTGLRWCDIDMESGMIDVNQRLSAWRIRKYSRTPDFPAISNQAGQGTIGEVAEAYSA